ncbi:unnamed protein product [Microthlaspi erraticum]|uniref:Uncharacterized protein n=1 Tax=Microthlaspi erraticum TaxID=1685480 RepID=A0A6D2L6C4_9BRAS|nr:unnamed protein product [Microthlaspi erraticum]
MDCCLSESQFPSTPFGPPLLMFVSQLSDTILSTAGIAACTPPTSYAPWMGNFILASFYVQVTMGGSTSHPWIVVCRSHAHHPHLLYTCTKIFEILE